jgi:hypothetical protein
VVINARLRWGRNYQEYGGKSAADGNKFVYASAEIALEAARRARHEDSLLAENAGFNLEKYTGLERPVAPVILSPVGFRSDTTTISEKEAA